MFIIAVKCSTPNAEALWTHLKKLKSNEKTNVSSNSTNAFVLILIALEIPNDDKLIIRRLLKDNDSTIMTFF